HDWAYVDLATVINNQETMEWLIENILERHAPVDGLRTHWSVQDVKDQWGVERHTTDIYVFPDDDHEEVTNVPEWRDRLLIRREAEIEAGSARTFRRWVKDGLIEPEGRMVIAGVMTPWYRWSRIVAIKQE